MDKKIVILGAGVSGLTLKKQIPEAIIIEKNHFAGGLCHTFRYNDFYFDCTGHYLHSERNKLLNQNAKMKKIKRNSKIYIENKYIDYPFQTHFHSLKKNIVKECIKGFMEREEKIKVRSIYDWVMKYYGKGIGNHFMFPYNEKLWRKPVDNLNADWMGSFIPKISNRDILHGGKTEVGYNSFFYYPKSPGFDNILKFNENEINLEEKAIKIDIQKKILYTNKNKYKYDVLASTIPPIELMKLTGHKVKGLEFTSVYNINLAVKGEKPENFHWVYVPEKKHQFYRVGIPSNVNELMCPKGYYLLSVEISYRNMKNIDYENVFESLKSMKLLKNRKEIVMRFDIDIKYGYVLYNNIRKKLVKSSMHFLNENNIYSIGRYGQWRYSYVSSDILNAERTSEIIKEKLKWR